MKKIALIFISFVFFISTSYKEPETKEIDETLKEIEKSLNNAENNLKKIKLFEDLKSKPRFLVFIN